MSTDSPEKPTMADQQAGTGQHEVVAQAAANETPAARVGVRKTVASYLSSITGWLEPMWQVTRHGPVSFGLLALMWILFFAGGNSAEGRRAAFGIEQHGHLLSHRLVTCGLTVGTFSGLIIATIAVIFLALPAEKLLGSVRFVIVAVVAQVITVPLVFGLAKLMVALPIDQWTDELAMERFLSPVVWMSATLAFASSYAPILWQRRIRIFLLSLSVTLVLYSGSISDVAFLVATLLAMLAGAVVHHRGGMRYSQGLSQRESRVIVAICISAVALGPVLAFFNQHAAGPLSGLARLMWEPTLSAQEYSYLCHVDADSESCREAIAATRRGVGPMVANLVPLALQLVLMAGLVRGRRFAWWATLFVQILSAMGIWLETHIVQLEFGSSITGHLSSTTAMLPWIFSIGVLVWNRRRFQVRTTANKIARFWAVTAIAWVSSAVAWLLGGYLLRNSFVSALSWGTLLGELPLRYLPPPLAVAMGIEFIPQTSVAWFVFEWVSELFWFPLLWALWTVLMTTPDARVEADRTRAHSILIGGTGDHLSWMTLWNGNRYWFDEPSGGSYVAYRVRNGIALTLGGPVLSAQASPNELGEVANRFEAFADSQGLITAWYSVGEEFACTRTHRGWHKQHVAEESVLDSSLHEFRGKKFQNVRTARNHARKEGITAVWTTWEHASPMLRQKMMMLSEQWLSDKALPEMGFTLGTLSELNDPDTQILLAVDGDGRVHGMTSWLPAYHGGRIAGIVLDVMRRDASGFRPVIEYLISEAMIEAHQRGWDWISLSGAPLARSEMGEPTILDTALDKVGEHMEPLYGFRALAASKNKFQPVHHPWYLCFKDELSLPSIGLAVAGAYLPQLGAADAAAVVRAWAKAQQAA
ncbi:DUF2156 domain-containing protein [Corynebacterium sp. SCR221107]|uniref:bifunctional lysylphosphatidylglycerol flippase/synthetase MprF n=2 Tax=Bacteria TaxID=2 RepID=UPI0022EC550C|nr:DUF2156 domain-containing protein [Corynebacterium sp. SCR221107]WBT09816.1 DUF2156 domain-containing protein [Corynebacterium sp. SCR221107]